MSYVVAAHDYLTAAAHDIAAAGSVVSAANAAAAGPTTSLLLAASDEVSTRIAALFSAHGRDYQSVSARVTQFSERFAAGLAGSARAYETTEIANAAAATRITLPGAGPLYYPKFITELPYLGQILLMGGVPGPPSVSILQGYALLNQAIGGNWFPGTIAQVVNYPATAGIPSGGLGVPTTNEAVAIGQQMLNAQIMGALSGGSPVHVAGLSMGTIVANRELAMLAADPASAPPPGALQFALFSSPELGLARTYLPNGTTVPLIDYTVQYLSDTQYNVDVVFGQYDMWGNPPDRPWNLPAVVNSIFGMAYQHNTAALRSMADAVQVSTMTMPLGGTVNTYMIPAHTLPMLMPLAEIGVPAPIVGALDSLLRPVVDAGYSSLTPAAGPYFSGGSLIGVPTAAEVVTSLQHGLSAIASHPFS